MKKVYQVEYYTMSGGGLHSMLVQAESSEQAIEYVQAQERQPLDGIRTQIRQGVTTERKA